LANQLQQASPGMVIVFVFAQMLIELANPRRQERNLNFGRAHVFVMDTELPNNFGLTLSGQHYASNPASGVLPSVRYPFSQLTSPTLGSASNYSNHLPPRQTFLGVAARRCTARRHVDTHLVTG
jgi:hypothetical protein